MRCSRVSEFSASDLDRRNDARPGNGTLDCGTVARTVSSSTQLWVLLVADDGDGTTGGVTDSPWLDGVDFLDVFRSGGWRTLLKRFRLGALFMILDCVVEERRVQD